jgi:hypothetical protein
LKYYAKVRFFSHEEGGRFTPPRTGFKPHLQVGDEFTSCVVTTADTSIETMEFGNLRARKFSSKKLYEAIEQEIKNTQRGSCIMIPEIKTEKTKK